MKTITATLAAALACTALISAPIAAAATPTDTGIVLNDDSADAPEAIPEDGGVVTSDATGVLVGSGSISGRVTRERGGDPVAGVRVFAEEGGGRCGSSDLRFADTDANGEYTISDVPPGPHHVWFGGFLPEGLRGEYYNDDHNPCSANTTDVTVIGGQQTTGINAALEEFSAAHITGRVSRDSGELDPIEGLQVCAESIAIGIWPGPKYCGYTQSDSTYAIQGIEPGSYVIHFLASSQGDIQGEFYRDTTDRREAQVITLTDGLTVFGINASLDDVRGAGSISGRVTRERGGDPVAGVRVFAEEGGGRCGSSDLRFADTDANGEYTISDVPPGPHHVWFGGFLPEGLRGEYYNDDHNPCSANTTDVTVIGGQQTTGINAALEE